MAIWTITRLTFLEAVRRRIALAAIGLGLAFLVVFGLGMYFIINNVDGGLPQGDGLAETLFRSQIYGFLSQMGLYAINFLSIAMGALLSADTLAGEIASGTIQAVVTKPVRRAEVVLGKWLGYAMLLGLYLLMMVGGLSAVVYGLTRYVVPNIGLGLLLIYVEVLVIMSLTLLCSSSFSTLATGGIVFGMWGMAFIGGFVEQVGAILENASVINIGIISSLILPTEAIFRRAAYEMTSPTIQALGISSGPMFVISVPSRLMVVYGLLYLVAMLALTIRRFKQRDL